jgi:hypothetical protein
MCVSAYTGVEEVSQMTDPDKARLTAEIPRDLMRRVRVRAAETDREIRHIVEEALEQYLASKPKRGGKS